MGINETVGSSMPSKPPKKSPREDSEQLPSAFSGSSGQPTHTRQKKTLRQDKPERLDSVANPPQQSSASVSLVRDVTKSSTSSDVGGSGAAILRILQKSDKDEGQREDRCTRLETATASAPQAPSLDGE